MSKQNALLAVAGIFVFALLATFGPPAVQSLVASTIFGL